MNARWPEMVPNAGKGRLPCLRQNLSPGPELARLLFRWQERKAGDKIMIGKVNATPMIAVSDLDRARKFYQETLGLGAKEAMAGEVLEVTSGETLINVYRSEFAGTNKATALTFDVKDIAAEVRDLKGKGVFFEQYDVPGLERQGDVYVGEGMKTAWFKDPDGNILSLFEGS